MKKVFNFLFLIMGLSLVVSCSKSAGDEVETGEATEVAQAEEALAYNVDAAASSIAWLGTKPTGKHTGTLAISGGHLDVKDGAIVAGGFTIDMTSMASTDLEGEEAGKLIGHLASPDFFDVATFPTAKFEIAEVKKNGAEDATYTHTITGNLTMKDSTKSVNLPAIVSMTDSTIVAETPQFTIDRTKWAVNYGSPSVLNLKDNFINDEMGLTIKLTANKGEAHDHDHDHDHEGHDH